MEKSQSIFTRNFIVISIINLLIFFSFQMLLPTLPIYIERLGGEKSVIGLINGIFVISAVAIRPFSGMLLDRLGRKKVFLVGLIIFILSVFSYSLFSVISIILLIRFIHGFGWGAASTASSTIASDNIPKERFGEGMGYFSLTASLAMALAPMVGLSIVSKYDFNTLFMVSTVLAAIGFIIAIKVKYKKIDVSEKKGALFEKMSITPSIIVFFVSITYGALVSFLPLYALERGVEDIGIFFTIYAVSLFVSRPIFGKIIDKIGYDYAIIPGLIFLFISLGVLSNASSMPMFLLTGVMYGVGFGAVQSSLQTMAVAGVAPHRLGAANATFLTAFDCGIGLGSILFGVVSSSMGYSKMYIFASMSAVIAFILYFIIGRKKVLEMK